MPPPVARWLRRIGARTPQTAACRAEQVLHLRKEISFLVIAGWHADTALWHEQTTASTHAQHQAQEHGQEEEEEQHGGEAPQVLGNTSSGGNVTQPTEAARLGTSSSGSSDGGGTSGGTSGAESAAGFLAAALEGSSNSSRLEAKLAVSRAELAATIMPSC